ncbi:hypothetical protein QE152_g25999 [Popillia japonica]|uniref:Uncharacterized protein n=1 Tax=Popillia japonica TaxID=7064 RepID=A0AAW1JY73_POPJA
MINIIKEAYTFLGAIQSEPDQTRKEKAIEYIFAFVKVITSKMAFTAEHDAFILMAIIEVQHKMPKAIGDIHFQLKNCPNKQQNGHHFQHLL